MSHDPQPLGGKIISKPVMIFGPLSSSVCS